MAFVLEPGSGLTNSNGYIDEAFFVEYHTDRGNSIVDPSTSAQWTTAQIQAAIIRASDYLDTRFVFIGIRKIVTQAMEWPRSNAFYKDGRIASAVPIEVKEACAEYALRSLTAALAPDPTYDDSNRQTSRVRERVGPIEQELEFGSDGAPITFRAYPIADKRLRELIISGQYLERV